jgi:hypothetical protein
MPHNDADNQSWSLHVHQGRCNAQRLCAPHLSVSTCSRGCPYVHLNTAVHGTVWGDAADRAAEAVYYKETSAGNPCVRSESLGFSHDDLLIFPSYLQFHRDRYGFYHTLRRRSHAGFRSHYRSSGHRDHDGWDCTRGLRCSCEAVYTHCHCAESWLGRCDHLCWLREFIDTGTLGSIADLTKILSISHTIITGKRRKCPLKCTHANSVDI